LALFHADYERGIWLSSSGRHGKTETDHESLQAWGWNEKLAYWKDNFKKLRNDLHFALSLNTAKTVHDMGIQSVFIRSGRISVVEETV
jgi:hypothetical protein